MSKIAEAAAATDAVQREVGRALERLNSGFNGRIVNGYGVYSDPSRQRTDLRAALEALTAALAVIDRTSWPTPRDYESAEA